MTDLDSTVPARSDTPPPSTERFELDTNFRAARFREVHTLETPASMQDAWGAALTVTAADVKAFGPLIRLRALPHRLLDRRGVADLDDRAARPMLAMFEAEGFIQLRRDDDQVGDSFTVAYGAAGQFWRPAHNSPIGFASPGEFLEFDRPNFARLAFTLSVTDLGDRRSLRTETRVAGIDRGADLKFAAYWAIIRLPSGLIRRSWLAAIDRRAREMR